MDELLLFASRSRVGQMLGGYSLLPQDIDGFGVILGRHCPGLILLHEFSQSDLSVVALDEMLNGFETQFLLQHLDVLDGVSQSHDVLDLLLCVDPVESILGQNLQFLHDQVADLHDLGPGNWFHVQE